MFDPREQDAAPVPDITKWLAKRERLNCPMLALAHRGVEIDRRQAELDAARAEHGKAIMLHALSYNHGGRNG